MRLVTFNTNFGKAGFQLINLCLDADIICMQRFDLRDISLLKLDDSHVVHHATSHPHDPALNTSGLCTIYRKTLDPLISVLDLGPAPVDGDRYQGSTAVVLDMGDHRIVNSLVGGPTREQRRAGDMTAWSSQVQNLFDHVAEDRCIIVGDFHHEDRDSVWRAIDLRGLSNMAAHINAFTDADGGLLSLTKIWSRGNLGVRQVQLAIDPWDRPEYAMRSLHWPLTCWYQP